VDPWVWPGPRTKNGFVRRNRAITAGRALATAGGLTLITLLTGCSAAPPRTDASASRSGAPAPTTVPSSQVASHPTSPTPVAAPSDGGLTLTATVTPARVGVCTQTGPGACEGYPAGSSVQFAATVRNTGAGRLTGPGGGRLSVTVQLAPVLTNIRATVVAAGSSSPHSCAVRTAAGAITVACPVDPLAPRGSANITILATLTRTPATGKLVTSFNCTAEADGRVDSASTTTSTVVGPTANGA
jgi:hypothetical protein